MRLGVTGRSRTGTGGFTVRGSAIELRPHPSARTVWSRWQDSNRHRLLRPPMTLVIPNHARCHLRHTELKRVYAGGISPPACVWPTLNEDWTRRSDSNGRGLAPTALQAVAFDPLATSRRVSSIGSERAARRLQGDQCAACRATRATGIHFGCAQTRASRRMWCLAARGPGFGPRTSRTANTMSRGRGVHGHTRSGADDEPRTRDLNLGMVLLCQ